MRKKLIHFLKLALYFFVFWVNGQFVFAQKISHALSDTSQNFIQNTQNNTNWIRFATQVNNNRNNNNSATTIVHLGDSHIQGGYYTNRVRELLSQKYGSQERGFVFPYSLLKANGPEDVNFYSSSAWLGQKYNHSISKDRAELSGYHLALADSVGSMLITLRQGSDKLYPFHELIVYHGSAHFQIVAKSAVNTTMDSIEPGLFATKMVFDSPMDSVRLKFYNGQEASQLYGFELRNNKHGIVYHSVGVNGASFESYANAINYIPILKAMQPNCVIISLGTNDAYSGQLDTIVLKKRIVSVVGNIRKELPDACILLTTPGDHLLHKRNFNNNLIKATAVIISTAIEQHCVFWDFFNVMGGLGASKKWSKNGLMYRDMLHLSKKGYKLQGDLFFEAFDKAIEKTSTNL